jgi:hypothetical protein
VIQRDVLVGIVVQLLIEGVELGLLLVELAQFLLDALGFGGGGASFLILLQLFNVAGEFLGERNSSSVLMSDQVFYRKTRRRP